MCVLQPCANPTGVGVWRDDTKWCQYSKEHDALIRQGVKQGLNTIDLGSIKSSVHPKGARNTAHLKKMEQVAVSSGQVRPILIYDGPAPLKALKKSKPPQSTPQAGPRSGNIFPPVHFRDASGQLQQYDKEIAMALMQALVKGNVHSLVLETSKSGRILYFDIPNMEQYFVERFDSGEPVLTTESPVKVIIEVPWYPEAMLALVKTAEGVMRKTVVHVNYLQTVKRVLPSKSRLLSMTVDRYRSEEYLEATLPDLALPRTIISKTVDSELRLGHLVFDKFLDALERNLTLIPIELFIKHSVPGDNQEFAIVKTVFKPLGKQKEIEESQSGAKSFWLGMAAPLAAAQAVVCGSAILGIMAYLVIDPAFAQTGWRLNTCNAEVLKIKQWEHCLTLAELSVR